MKQQLLVQVLDMHDCRRSKYKLIDLVFNEAIDQERSLLLAEISMCKRCRDLYASMSGTLLAFEQAPEPALPEESYWADYEERLRLKLMQKDQPSKWQMVTGLFARPLSFSNWPTAIKVGLPLMFLALTLWVSSRLYQSATIQIENASRDSSQSGDKTERPDPQSADITPQTVPAEPGRTITSAPRRHSIPSKHAPVRLAERKATGFDSQPAPRNEMGVIPLIDAGTAEHIARVELLLRSLRNVRPQGEGKYFDVSFEKQLSRDLLSRNILLRRSAQSKGSILIGDLLTSVETFLLEIANLPERPSHQEIVFLKELVEEKSIIAMLHLYSV